MIKHRKAFQEIEKVLNLDVYGVIILFGLRKTGKTTILKQLTEKYDGCYIDFRNSKDPENDYLGVYDREEKLILLDEIGYLPSFDAYFGNLEKDIKSAGKKVIITSSSYGALKQLEAESLGGGRSYPVQLFPLCFEEYLYFSDRISKYGEDYEPTDQDLQDFYRLKNVPAGMDFIVNREYLRTVFTDIEIARNSAEYAIRDIELTRNCYMSVLDVIAYTLNDKISIKRFRGMMQVGAQEFGRDVKGLSISKSLISLANNIISKATNGLFTGIEIKDLALIVLYLYHNGFLFVDLARNEANVQSYDRITYQLSLVRTFEDIEQILKTYTFSVISPLLYSRLMIDLESIADKLCSGAVYGRLYELTIKSESVYKLGYVPEYYSYKYISANREVDLWERNILLEGTISDESNKRRYWVDKVAFDYQVIRVLTNSIGVYSFNGVYYRIGYLKALLMISNGSIFDLEATKVIEQ